MFVHLDKIFLLRLLYHVHLVHLVMTSAFRQIDPLFCCCIVLHFLLYFVRLSTLFWIEFAPIGLGLPKLFIIIMVRWVLRYWSKFWRSNLLFFFLLNQVKFLFYITLTLFSHSIQFWYVVFDTVDNQIKLLEIN